MNELNLRVSGGIGEKVKKPAAPLSVPYTSEGAHSEFFQRFLSCNSADNQLKLLKQFLNSHKDDWDQDSIRFLVRLFWHTDAKHPVKGFLKKHITESSTLRQPFTDTLISLTASELASLTICDYIDTITRLDATIDKFPPGAVAVSTLEVSVTAYCVRCLETCGEKLGIAGHNMCTGDKFEPLPPTDINKIYDLVHLTLRLLLYMLQKVTEDGRNKLSSMFEGIRSILKVLMLGKEVPMDTKSVSGIIYVTMHLFENGPESWIMVLEEDRTNENGTVNLVVYSAVATVVPPTELMLAKVNGQPAVLDLTDKILAIGDRFSSEPSHTLAVARTLLSISRSLGSGAPLAAKLAPWCWSHLEHHMDSVRHLTAQITTRVVEAAVRLQKQGDSSTLENLFTSLDTLDSSRKSFYVTLTAMAEIMGAGVIKRRPDVIRDVIGALKIQAVQACATTFLETLLKKHMKESDTETIYRQWISVILETVKRESDPAVLGILEKILTKAVQWDSEVLRYILPEQQSLRSYDGSDLKCILLVLGVVRKSGVAHKGVTFDELRHTAYDADDETRILSLSLISESPRSTQPLSEDELAFVLHFLEYNINAQSPSFRQLVLANMKKILKRLEDSYKVINRKPAEHSTEVAYYLNFMNGLRDSCFASLLAANSASYGRRYVALQLLSWQDLLQIEGWNRAWTEKQAEILYNLLEDSYENNKALALEVLKNCPVEIIKPLQSDVYVEGVIEQASSVRPTDCVSASYKLLLMLSLNPQPYKKEDEIPWPLCYGLIVRILNKLKHQASCAEDILRAARDAPMYGLVHCLARLIGCLDASAIAGNPHWSELVTDIITTCEVVNSIVAAVVTAASPEGLLPDDTNSDSSGGTRLADGRAVSAQMLLLCAWRSVKETSLLLGSIVSRLCLEGEAPKWTLSSRQVEEVGEHLIMLLSTVKHRGAFEQAYVGFTLLLGRLWKCTSSLHQLPLQWFAAIERDFVLPTDGTNTEYCATRRGAGLPFMIQALVTTELATEPTAPRGRLLTRCLRLCLSAALSPSCPSDAARAHLVLRALYRHTTPPAEFTAEAIMVAIRGFEADTWTERNSSTLLFSALTVRVFGVARSSGHKLSPRNTMTGRIFFLRYPQLYDFLLEQLKSASPESELRPSLFPTLLLLARLYPSALEGTVSNLKLERFLPHVVSLGGARDVSTRRLAARAAAALVPHRCIDHVQSLLVTVGNPNIKRNLCHGLLCQLTVLLELKSDLTIEEQSRRSLLAAIRGTFFILEHMTSEAPCYLVADEWLKFINLAMMRFPNFLDDDLPSLSSLLETILFYPSPTITSGREIFLTNATYLSLIINTSPSLLIRYLRHTDYEVNLAALNYLLILHGYKEDSCPFLEHLSLISKEGTLRELEGDGKYVEVLCKVTQNGYLECKQKALKVLALTRNTQRDIVKLKLGEKVELNDEIVILELIDSIRNGHASLNSIYLTSLLSFVSNERVLEVLWVLYKCSAAGNDEGTREIVVGYLEKHLKILMEDVPSADKAEMFEWSATLFATVAILLEDDAPAVRQRAANAVLKALQDTDKQQSISAYSSQQWRRAAAAGDDAPALQLALAALHFCAGLHGGDELGEECRVFDQNETHNVYLEEFTWSRDCALELKRIYKQTCKNHTIEEYLQTLLTCPDYNKTIKKLCIDNVGECLTGRMKTNNPKIDIFLKILHE